mmetsp:Transcript_9361/g.35035  ORF Transcript_9361/g.35035 Transcript_9361/m.35035 type:complete len:457 (+) Transcript_9361:617-1987(+)
MHDFRRVLLHEDVHRVAIADAQHMPHNAAARDGLGVAPAPGYQVLGNRCESLQQEEPECRVDVLADGLELVHKHAQVRPSLVRLLHMLPALGMRPVGRVVSRVGPPVLPRGLVDQEGPKRIGVLHPLEHARLGAQRYNPIGDDSEVLRARGRVLSEHLIDRGKGLLHDGILPRVVLPLDELLVSLPISPDAEDDLRRRDALIRNLEAVLEPPDANDACRVVGICPQLSVGREDGGNRRLICASQVSGDVGKILAGACDDVLQEDLPSFQLARVHFGQGQIACRHFLCQPQQIQRMIMSDTMQELFCALDLSHVHVLPELTFSVFHARRLPTVAESDQLQQAVVRMLIAHLQHEVAQRLLELLLLVRRRRVPIEAGEYLVAQGNKLVRRHRIDNLFDLACSTEHASGGREPQRDDSRDRVEIPLRAPRQNNPIAAHHFQKVAVKRRQDLHCLLLVNA